LILLRSFLFAIVFYAWSVAWAIAMVPMLAAPRSWLLAGMRAWSRSLNVLLKVICGIRVEIRGQEHVPSADALIASKHQTMFDVFVQFGVLKGSLFVFKKELLIIPIFGWIALKIGSIVVDRQGRGCQSAHPVSEGEEACRPDQPDHDEHRQQSQGPSSRILRAAVAKAQTRATRLAPATRTVR